MLKILTQLILPIYNLIEYSDNYSTTSGNSWHFYRDEPFLNANDATADFPADKQSAADAFKTYSRKSHSKNRELTGNLIGYKNANKITKVSKNSKQNKLETKNDKEIPNERYMSPEEKTRHY